jgi:hypothetical protein
MRKNTAEYVGARVAVIMCLVEICAMSGAFLLRVSGIIILLSFVVGNIILLLGLIVAVEVAPSNPKK